MILALGWALAGAPQGLRPMVLDWGAPERWATWARSEARAPRLACDVLVVDHAHLCFRVLHEGTLRLVTLDDLALWGATIEELRAAVVEGARAHLAAGETLPVEGMGATYTRWVDGEGWAAAPFLLPQVLVARVGPDARFALPAWTVSMVWAPGDGELDKVLAVGVVEVAKEQPGEVTPVVFRFDGSAFVPFAEATPTSGNR